MTLRSHAAFVAATLIAGRAVAQNADGILLGTEAALTGGAVLSTAHDAAGAYYNPAGLAALPASALQISGSVYQLSSFRLRSFVRTTLPWTRIDQSLTATDWSSAPSVAVYGLRLSPRLGLALGVWIPARESISLVSTVHSAGPVAAGGTVVQVDYTQQIAFTQRIERSYFGAAAGLGLRMSVAAALKTPALALVTMGGVTTVIQSASLLPGAPPTVAFSQAPSPVSGIAEPWRVAVGSAIAVGDTSLRAELDWQAPQSGRHGVVNARAGLHRTASPDFAWGLGIFTDRSREDVRSGALSVDYYGVAAGVDYRPPPVRSARQPGAAWDVRASLAVRYALGVGDVERAEANPFTSTAAPSTPSTASVVAHALSLNVGALMQF